MHHSSYITYLRANRDHRDKPSPYGLVETQREAAGCYVESVSGTILREYVAVDCFSNRQPQLRDAIDHCRGAVATLVIADLGRIEYVPSFLWMLAGCDIDFIALDQPRATKQTVRLAAIIADLEQECHRNRRRHA